MPRWYLIPNQIWWSDPTTTSSTTTWTITAANTFTVTTPTITSTAWDNQTSSAVYPMRLLFVEQWADHVNHEVDVLTGELQQAARIDDLRSPRVRSAQMQEQMRAHEAQARRINEQYRRDAETRRGAEAKARELLLAALTPAERTAFEHRKVIEVTGRSGRLYRIRDVGHLVANIDVVERDLLGHERTLHRLCGHIGDHGIPHADHLLAQKLMLEADEDAFLRLANRHP